MRCTLPNVTPRVLHDARDVRYVLSVTTDTRDVTSEAFRRRNAFRNSLFGKVLNTTSSGRVYIPYAEYDTHDAPEDAHDVAEYTRSIR